MGGGGGASLRIHLPLPGRATHDMALTLGVAGDEGATLLHKLHFFFYLRAQAVSLWAFVHSESGRALVEGGDGALGGGGRHHGRI